MVIELQKEEIVTSSRRLRSILAQLVACSPPNLLLFGLGVAISFATIALPALLNSPESLSFNEVEASWFGSIVYLTQPIGALMSGPVMDNLGRKKANCIVNIPHLIAWIVAYFAWNSPSLFLANGLLGLGIGIMEAPVNSFAAEISEPSLRGSLCTLTTSFLSLGILFMYFLGTVVNWRTAALISFFVPVSAMILVLFIPDTPVWLLSRGRDKDALKSLCYLRGWTKPENVKEEFDDLVLHCQKLRECVICYKTGAHLTKECVHVKMNFFKRFILKFRHVMLAKETLRPLCFSMMYFTFYQMSGLAAMRPNLVNICRAFGMPGDAKETTVRVGVMLFVMNVFLVGLVKLLGKRKTALISMFGSACSAAGLGIYAGMYLDEKVFSYNAETFPSETSYVPLVMLYLLTIFTALAIPWVILGEVFPFRSRATAQGIAAAGNYVIMFIAAKTFIDLEISVQLWGTFAFYAALGFLGTVFLYFFLPETEGKTLQEVEDFYNGELRIFADDPFINFFRQLTT